MLQDLFIGTIRDIIHTVKRTLVEDCRKEKLIEHVLNPHISDKKQYEEQLLLQSKLSKVPPLGQFVSYKLIKNHQTNQSVERPVLTKIKVEYKDQQDKYEDILLAIGDYFELFKTNTTRLEGLWLQLLNYFGLRPAQDTTIFRE